MKNKPLSDLKIRNAKVKDKDTNKLRLPLFKIILQNLYDNCMIFYMFKYFSKIYKQIIQSTNILKVYTIFNLKISFA